MSDDAVFLVVPDTLQALQTLCAHHRSRFHIPVVAITGSNGKTTVKEWLYQLLSPDMNVVRSPRSYNSQIGVPLSLWLIDAHTDLAIIEAGISQPGEMATLAQMICPTTAVITNIGQAHQENFASMEQKEAEKRLLLEGAQTTVVDRKVDDFRVREIEKENTRATIRFEYRGQLGQYTIPFIDDAAIENSLTCFTTCLALTEAARTLNTQRSTFNVQLSTLCQRMEQLEPVAMRLEVKEGRNGCTLITDTCNSDLVSLEIALDFMRRRPEAQGRRRVLILSDIKQTGLTLAELYAQVAELVNEYSVDAFIGIGPEVSAGMANVNIEILKNGNIERLKDGKIERWKY
jgi:alanine racemase